MRKGREAIAMREGRREEIEADDIRKIDPSQSLKRVKLRLQ